MEHHIPCIAIDVSKGKSHVCGFSHYWKPITKVFKITHDATGFDKLTNLFEELRAMTSREPLFIFESTGIYHRSMKRFFVSKDYPFVEVSPLLAAKHRKNSAIRSAKTDARDTHALAKLFYSVDLLEHYHEAEVYYELRQLHRYYEALTTFLVKAKVHFNEKLDIVFPRFRQEISKDVYSRYYLELIKKYPHPDILKKKSDTVVERMLMKYGIRKSRAGFETENIKVYAQNCFAGSDQDSVDSQILADYIELIQVLMTKRSSVIDQMINLGKDISLYTQLQTIPGIASITAISLVSELGDLNRFENRKQLTAYAGLDPIVAQSGNLDGKGLKISKKGNKYLRKLLYTTTGQSVTKTIKLHPIKECYQKKKQTGTKKSAKVATSDKLLRTIFGMHKSGNSYIL